ncbi:MAG: glycosyltransferase [candidate division WOR-3 bacterium]
MKVQFLKSGEPLPNRVGDVLAVLEDNAAVIYENLKDIPKHPIVVGKYIYKGKVFDVGDFQDFTERAELGPLRLYHWDFLEGIKAWKYGKFWEYYARLQLYIIGKNHLVLDRVLSERFSVEGFGKLYSEAFKYLTYSQEDEIALEGIFKDFLVKIGAYLNKPLDLPLKEKPHKPYISVIIPVRNRERFIGKALESILENDFPHLECIVVDNGSTDNTREIVKRFSQGDGRIKLVEVYGESLAGCLNMGIKNSKGWIISQLDSDDFYSKDALRTVYEYHKEYPVGLAVSYYQVVDEKGNPIGEMGTVKHLEFSINNILRVEGAGAVRSYKREVLERIGGFDEVNFPNFAEDYDVVLKISELYRIGRIHKVLYYYRRHPESTDATRPLLEKKRIKNSARKSAFWRRRVLNLTKQPAL